jgi:LysR family glycine cleavage system transcriptional activator
MGPTALIGDDVAAGRLIAPFPDVSLPARSYFAYLPTGTESGSQTAAFCDWLEQEGQQSAGNATAA